MKTFKIILIFFYSATLMILFPYQIYSQDITINTTEDSVYVFDNFDIVGTPISDVNGQSGKGWDGPWQAPPTNGTVSASETGLTYPLNVNLIATGGHAYSSSPYGQGIGRKLLHPIKLGEVLNTFYISFLTKKDATGNYRIEGLTSTGTSAGFAVGVTSDGRLKVNAGNTAGWAAVTTQSDAGLIQNDVTYFIVVRYQYENSQSNVKIAAFKEGDVVPDSDASFIWNYETTGGSLTTSMYSLRLAFTKGLGRVDEFRLGSTWTAVTSQDVSEIKPIIGTYRFPNFDWEDHPDQFADPANPIRYEIEIANDNQFSSLVDRDTVMLSRYVHDKPFNTGTFFWRTRNIKYNGEISAWQDTLSFAIEEVQEIISVSAPSGQDDCTSNVQASVYLAQTLAAEGKSVKIIFPAGDYYFGESLVGTLINLNRVRNIEIDGSGAIFHFSKRNQGLITATACENISISGISVTYPKGVFRVQGHVLSVNQSTRTVKISIQEGSPDFSFSSNVTDDIFILLDPVIDGRLKNKSSNFYRMNSYTKNDDNTYTVNISDGGDISQWKAGDRYVFHFRGGSSQYINFPESKNMTAHNLTTDGWGSMGFVSVKGSNFNILNCKTIMKEGEWMMGNADGVHIREHIVGPWVEGSEIQATGDDGLALYSRPIAMTSIKPNGNVKAAICVSEFFNLEKGDKVSFFEPTQGRILLETSVVEVQAVGGTFLVNFADTLPDGMITGSPLVDVTQIWNRSKSCGEFMIRNCKFINNRRFANVFRSKRGVIENSYYSGASSRAIFFQNETAFPNGLYASEIIIRNNIVEDCSFDGAGTQAPISFYFSGKGASVQSIGPNNILIENNVIKDSPSPEISLTGAANVVIRNNWVSLFNGGQDDVNFSANRSGDIHYTTQVNPIKNTYIPAPAIYIVQASAGSNGTISPTGKVTFFSGTSQKFDFHPDLGYEVENVIVNGVSQGARNTYTMTNVTSNRSIQVAFRKKTGFQLLSAEADAYVHGGSYQSTNFGASQSLIIKHSTNLTYARKSYLRFDLNDLNKPVKSAKLTLKLASIDGGSATHNVTLAGDDNWSETTINWLNRPAEGIVLNSQVTPGRDKWIEFDVTNQVEAERIGDRKISFAIVSAVNSELMATYYSREAESLNSPQLIIVTDTTSATNEMNNNMPMLKVFPNPATTMFIVQFNSIDKADLVLFDAWGKKQISINDVTGQVTIPTRQLSAGVYFLRLSNENIFIVERVVVQ